jgi:hypothetical protein
MTGFTSHLSIATKAAAAGISPDQWFQCVALFSLTLGISKYNRRGQSGWDLIPFPTEPR